IKYGGDTRGRGGRGEYSADLFGTSATFSLDYINDPDPEIRKQTIKTIGLRESSDDIIIKLLERLRVEKDEGVRQEIQTALDNIRIRQTYEREGRGGGAAGLIR
ncbi:MAG: HEAT repeat domain-containing protein, partial [Candidatus Omnitrophica bacterium]|nr:HEAT repeat domain-containing protein [Candidatus Omnitrophota bacterium]